MSLEAMKTYEMEGSVILRRQASGEVLYRSRDTDQAGVQQRKRGSNEEKGSLEWGNLCHPSELGEPIFKRKSYF